MHIFEKLFFLMKICERSGRPRRSICGSLGHHTSWVMCIFECNKYVYRQRLFCYWIFYFDFLTNILPLYLFNSESLVFPSCVYKFKNWYTYIKLYFFCCFVWIWNLISHPKGKPSIEDIWEKYLDLKDRKIVTGSWRKLRSGELHNL
jgi:hypothetical protein